MIQNFGDLMKIEPHKLVVIFIDSNRRHIILENPESEIGEFKKQATDVFISLGCKFFFLYHFLLLVCFALGKKLYKMICDK